MAQRKAPIVWFIGGPGSGKHTLSEKMVQKYGIVYMSSGDLLQKEIATKSSRGGNIDSLLQRGDDIPTWLVLDLIKEELQLHPTAKGFVLEGYPRDREQGQTFEEEVGPVALILSLDASDETLRQRSMDKALTSGSPASMDRINNRIQKFHASMNSLRPVYGLRMKKINAERSPDEIFQQMEYYLNTVF